MSRFTEGYLSPLILELCIGHEPAVINMVQQWFCTCSILAQAAILSADNGFKLLLSV
jgi:hypothetical protein